MKSNRIIFLAFLFLFTAAFRVFAQDQRLLKTKVADILALLPAADHQQANRIFHELITLGDEGLVMVIDQVKPNGNPEGVAARYAVSILTHYATTKEDKAKVEQIYLTALPKSTEPEVKSYFIDNLKLTGSDASVKTLSNYVFDPTVADQAIGALTAIGTQEANQALLTSLTSDSPAQARLVKALGELKYQPALPVITKLVTSDNLQVRKQACWALALLADAGSYDILLQQAKNVGFNADPAEATHALIEYMHQLTTKGNTALVTRVSNAILESTPDVKQQHFRLAALESYVNANQAEAVKILLQERNRFDAAYRKEVLKIAAQGAGNALVRAQWEKEYKKATGAEQAELLSMMAAANRNDGFADAILVPALISKNQWTRMAAASEIALTRNKKYIPALLDYLIKCSDDTELNAAKSALLQVVDKDNTSLVAQKIESAPSKNKVVLIQILAGRRAVNEFGVVAKLTSSGDAAVKEAAFDALPYVSTGTHTGELLNMLSATGNEKEVKAIQTAIIAGLDKNSVPLVNGAYQKETIKLLPVLPYMDDPEALGKVTSKFNTGNDKEKEVAFEAMTNWQNNEAVRTLIVILKDESLKKYHGKAFYASIIQISKSAWPDDQKLLMLRELMVLASDRQEKNMVLRAAGSVRTFLSLIFVAGYLDEPDLSSAASRAAMQIALPTPDARPGMTGMEVRSTLQRMLSKLTGEDSQYERIDIATYLEGLPYTKGYESIFNGKDLSGWQGLVENPVARSKMTKEDLAKKQAEANGKVKNNWSVKDGCIVFQGDGANLCTTRTYADFEMLVDWKISKNGDSGIYLRGSPQVQIWDIARVDAGAQVGSGGLYNNKKERSTPLVVADNPVGEWNTFYIRMIGDHVTVYLNGVLAVDNVVMENYWDRNLPIFPEDAIELQAHGTELSFRNIYVKELGQKSYELTKEEKEQGYELLFNGKDLDNWTGNKTDYIVEDNTIAIYPSKESHGNLYTSKEYSDFVYRFQFQLTPGANNGLGIHAPLEGDAAYVGKELQILDNTAPVYANLEVWQYHGSVYGVIAAKRDYLKPVGEWNEEEVYVKGDSIRITLNGTVIVDGDLKAASKNGTLDHKDHPGLKRHTGHIGFLGHGSVVKFRNIRIKELAK